MTCQKPIDPSPSPSSVLPPSTSPSPSSAPAYIDFTIDSYTTEAFIDSGASSSFISSELAEQLKLKLVPLVSPIAYQGFAASSCLVTDIASVKFSIKENEFEHQFSIAALPHGIEVVIGKDLVKEVFQLCDIANNVCIINGQPHSLDMYCQSSPVAMIQYSSLEPLLKDRSLFVGTAELAEAMAVDFIFLKFSHEKSDATVEEKGFLRTLLILNSDIFVITDLPEAGLAKVTPFRIETGDAPPIYTKPTRVSPKDKEVVAATLEKLEKVKQIVPSQSTWASNIIVQKEGKAPRPCFGYHRTLNPVTKPIYRPPPRVDAFLDWTSHAKYLSSFDLAAGYHQIPVHPDDRHKTAFNTVNGLYECVGMPMGLRNAPAHFQMCIEETLAGLLWHIICSYIDDMTAKSRTFQGHLIHLQAVFNRLRNRRWYIKLPKSQIIPRELGCLGYTVTRSGLKVNFDKVKVVLDAAPPTNKHELQSFLGLANYYRKFIANYSHQIEPLLALLKKDVNFVWTATHQEAFDWVKAALTSPPVLAHPDFTKPFIVHTDASDTAIGATLCQEDAEGEDHVVAYYSAKLLPAEKNYPVHEREALAVVRAFKQFRVYLHSNFVTKVYTDNQAVKYLLSNRNTAPSSRITRWISYLQDFDFEVIHRPGSENTDADALSRAPIAMMNLRSKAPLDYKNLKNPKLPADAAPAPEKKPAKKKKEPEPQEEDQSQLPDLIEDEDEDEEFDLQVPDLVEEDASFNFSSQLPLPPPSVKDTSEPKSSSTQDAVAPPPLHASSNPQLVINSSVLAKEQRSDPDFAQCFDYLEKGILPTDAQDATYLLAFCNQLSIHNDLLYYVWWPQRTGVRDENRLLLCLPASLKNQVIKEYHESRLAGHCGFKKTLEHVQRNYFWKSIHKDVLEFVRTCPSCQFAKNTTRQDIGYLRPIHTERARCGYRRTPSYYASQESIHSFIRRSLTGWPEAFAMSSTKAKNIATIFCEELVCRYGVPDKLCSDQGKQLTVSKVVKHTASILGTELRTTTAYHPEGNGQAERFFRTIMDILKTQVTNHQRDWDLHLPFALASIRFFAQ